jgi:hypothetical protein
MSREFLVTKFVCAKCGANLNLSYDVPRGAGEYSDGEPTGALMVRSLIAVEPCKKCAEPMEDLKRAFKKAMA